MLQNKFIIAVCRGRQKVNAISPILILAPSSYMGNAAQPAGAISRKTYCGQWLGKRGARKYWTHRELYRTPEEPNGAAHLAKEGSGKSNFP